MPEYENQTKVFMAVFMAFCDAHRLQMLERLRGGEKCACALPEGLNIRQPALSYHIYIYILPAFR
jgi:ArsR family transcriptional regulator